MPVYQFDCTGCGQSRDELMTYEDMKAGVTCECGSHMDNVISAVAIKPSVDGAHKGRIARPNVGPLAKDTKAYQKRKDEENSKFYRPDQTFGQGTMERFNETKRKQGEIDKGKRNFTLDK